MRTQFHHVVDLAPTLYEVLGIDPPHEVDGVEQMPLEGVSMAYTFAAPEAPTRKHSQYWEYSGHRALWREGWLAVDLHQRGEPWSDQGWELYDTRSDFSLAKDLADERPVIGEELVTAWWAEARAHQVLPLDDRGFEKRLDTESRLSDGQPDRLVLLPGTSPIPVAAAPILSNRAHLVTARVSIPDRGAEGVLICQGSRFGGWSLYLRDRRLVYAHNFLGLEERRLVSDREVPAGDLVLQLRWTPSGAGLGTAELIIDHQPAGRSTGIPVARIGYMGDEGLQVGRNGGSSVTPDYASPYPFTGTIVDVVLEISEK